jgi:MFS family permease
VSAVSGDPATELTTRLFWQRLPREGRLLLSVIVLDSFGSGLVLPFTFVYLHDVLKIGVGAAGLLIAVQALAGVCAVLPSGTLVDRLGARRVLMVALGMFLLGDVFLALVRNPPGAVVGLVLTGAGLGVLQPAAQSLISTIVPSGLRPRYFAAYFLLFNLGIGLGGAVGGLFVSTGHPGTFETIFLVDAATFLPTLAVLALPLRHVGGPRAAPDGPAERTSGPGYLAVLRRPAVLALTLLEFGAVVIGYGQLTSGLPAFASSVSGVPASALVCAFAGNTAVIVLLQTFVVGRIERRRRTRVLAAAGAIWAAAWLLLGGSGLAPGSWLAVALLITFMAVFALGETFLQPTLPAIVNDLAPDDLRGRYNALSRTANQAGTVLGPVLAGLFLGLHLPTVYIGLLVAGNLLIAAVSVLNVERKLPHAANHTSD